MAFLDGKPSPFRRGQRDVSARSLNEINEAVPRQIRGGRHVDVSYFSDRLTIGYRGESVHLPDVRNYLAQFVVREIKENYLVCVPFRQPDDGTADTIHEPQRSSKYGGRWIPQDYNPDLQTYAIGQMVIAVAKPYTIQQQVWDGKTVILNGEAIRFEYTGVGTRKAYKTDNTFEKQVIVPDYFLGDIIVACRTTSGYEYSGGALAWTDLNTAGRAWARASGQ
jgi:hypothetical protein